jgi:hypothetical protein
MFRFWAVGLLRDGKFTEAHVKRVDYKCVMCASVVQYDRIRWDIFSGLLADEQAEGVSDQVEVAAS